VKIKVEATAPARERGLLVQSTLCWKRKALVAGHVERCMSQLEFDQQQHIAGNEGAAGRNLG
jgi:hypothetical protein